MPSLSRWIMGAIIATAISVGLTSHTNATTITFDGTPPGHLQPYFEKGYKFDNGMILYLGIMGREVAPGALPITMTQVGGGTFDLETIDFFIGQGEMFRMQFTFAGGGPTLYADLTNTTLSSFQTFTFNFRDLLSISWIGRSTNTGAGHSLLYWDNVKVSAAPAAVTPIPAALPLFVSALAGLGWVARRRRRQA